MALNTHIEETLAVDLERIFESPQNLFVFTYKNGEVKVLSQDPGTEQLSLEHYFHDHKGAIMAVAFSGPNFPNYLITASYDQTLNLYHLSNEDKQPLKFTHRNQDLEVGCFTHVVFDRKS